MSIEELSSTAADIEASAAQAATTYYDLAVKYGVAKYPRYGIKKGRNWTTFTNIARKCVLAKVDVTQFVTSAFNKVLAKHAIVTVSDIASCDPKSTLTKEESAPGISPKEMWNMLSCKLLDMVFSLDGVKNKVDILENSMYGFPAWFRVFSPNVPPYGIITRWGDLAYEEISENSELSSYLQLKRPETYELLQSVIKNI